MKLPKAMPFLIILSLAFNAGWTPNVQSPVNQAADIWGTDPNVQQAENVQKFQAEKMNVANLPSSPELSQPAPQNATYQVGLAVSQAEFAILKQQAVNGSGLVRSPAPDAQMDPADLKTAAPAPSAPLGPINSFAGPTQAGTCVGCVPPDSNLAVGPNSMIACVNSSFIGYSKTGVQSYNQSFATWWSSGLTGGYTFIFDPICRYDRLSNRFIIVALLYNASPLVSKYLVSVSTNSDNINWYNYAFDATLDGSTPTSFWADFPDVGVDNSAIYITSNQFDISNAFHYSKIRILDKASLYSGITPGWYDFWNMTNPTVGGNSFALRAAHNLGPNDIEYFVNSLPSGGSQLSLYRILTPLTSPTFQAAVSGTSVIAYSLAPNADQLGTTTLVDTGDTRLLNAVYRNGYLWTAHTISDGGAPAKACFRWYQLDPLTISVIQQGTFCSTGSYFYPAVTVDSSGNMGVTFSYSGSTVYPTMRYTGRLTTTSLNSLEGSNGVVSGLGPHTSGRWGDYGGAAMDPNGSKMWFIHEFAGNTSTTDWRTQIFSAQYRRDGVAVYRRTAGGAYWLNYDYSTASYVNYLSIGDGGTSAPCYPAPMDFNGNGIAKPTHLCGGGWRFFDSTGAFVKSIFAYMQPGDIPVPGDYNGDGVPDVAIFRRVSGGAYWLFYDYNTASYTHYLFLGDGGTSATCYPVAMDFNGDGVDEPTQMCGAGWHFFNSNGSFVKSIFAYMQPGDIPVPGDYNGDGRQDVAVYRRVSGGAYWLFYNFSTASFTNYISLGDGGTTAACYPVAMDYVGDGIDRPTHMCGAGWHFFDSTGTFVKSIFAYMQSGDKPVAGKYGY